MDHISDVVFEFGSFNVLGSKALSQNPREREKQRNELKWARWCLKMRPVRTRK
jgi:hypothetical protein